MTLTQAEVGFNLEKKNFFVTASCMRREEKVEHDSTREIDTLEIFVQHDMRYFTRSSEACFLPPLTLPSIRNDLTIWEGGGETVSSRCFLLYQKTDNTIVF